MEHCSSNCNRQNRSTLRTTNLLRLRPERPHPNYILYIYYIHSIRKHAYTYLYAAHAQQTQVSALETDQLRAVRGSNRC
jgi:hypothetical protein